MYSSKLFLSVFISLIIILLISYVSLGNGSNSTDRKLILKKNYPTFNDSLFAGRKIYDEYCAACHGVNGNGKGIDADQMKTKPTDFTSGMYKFKSTPFGTLPTVEDIIRTLKLGVRTTAMIPQWQLNYEQMKEVAEYILSFAPKEEITGKPIVIPSKPEITESFIKKGKKLFDANCASCHGKDAKGDGPSAGTLVNYKGEHIRPANLTQRPLKRANTSDWTYKIINNGIEGTPMPPYFDVIQPKDIWAVVDYLDSIEKVNLAGRNNGGMMGGMMGMMGRGLVGEENIGARIDMAAAHAWMMRRMMRR